VTNQYVSNDYFCKEFMLTDNEWHTCENGVISKVNKELISHPTRAQNTLSAVGTVQVSLALPAVRFPSLPRCRWSSFQYGVAAGEGFLRAPFWGVDFEVWLQCSLSFVHGLKKEAPHKNNVFFKPFMKLTLHCNHRSGHLKTEHTESYPAATPSRKLIQRPETFSVLSQAFRSLNSKLK
jgi:hypothetical protein